MYTINWLYIIQSVCLASNNNVCRELPHILPNRSELAQSSDLAH